MTQHQKLESIYEKISQGPAGWLELANDIKSSQEPAYNRNKYWKYFRKISQIKNIDLPDNFAADDTLSIGEKITLFLNQQLDNYLTQV